MVRNIVTNLEGFTVNDVLSTDVDALHGVLFADKEQKEPGRLIDWIKERQEGGK
ncbi:MAG: hypothetical protein LKJ29_05680 [Lactobacillus sp.]|jgi:hypothetical protein|nr:hypothetical protein [Lactobacillus sp.]MCI1971965.1 hypothetical protein [Lactobacillus sp.]MCI2036375.1 hypothetical protein [Lactobacillus sp.]